jgi:S1-C subfamily serine protease
VLPVTAILASDKFTDVCILRVQSPAPFEPLPLNTNVTPGDEVWCYSDPTNHTGFFSAGIVNRFYQHTHGPSSKEKWPLRMNVSTEWAPGSSGAAVLDRFGNAVAHVSAITPQSDHPQTGTVPAAGHTSEKTVLVFHDAVCAADVLALIKH